MTRHLPVPPSGLQECVLNCKVTSAAVQKKEEARMANLHRKHLMS